MTTRVLAVLALTAVLGSSAKSSAADDPKLPDTKAFDKLVIDSLRDVHNTGADLFNTDHESNGAYRMYQGALLTVRPLLGHRPEAQKLIDTGMAAADKESDVARKAFRLHETIEAVRKNLKVAIGQQKSDEPKKPDGKKPDSKKPDGGGVAPMPKGPKSKDAPAAIVNGKVTLAGQPLADGEVLFVSLNQPLPKAFTAAVKDGTYKIVEIVPPGKYGALVTGKGVPEKYALVNTSGLVVEFAAGPNNTDLA